VRVILRVVNMEQADVILIPGGGLNAKGQLPPWTIARIETALTHYHQGSFMLCLSAGTVHKPPPRNNDGYPIFESRAAARYLLDQGIPENSILIECSSYDTIGNAYFSRMEHVQPARFQTIKIVTSQFHLRRLELAFKWVYQLSPTPYPFQLQFIASPDRGMNKDLLQARREKENKSTAKLQKLSAGISTLKEFHTWLYSKHEAYAAGKIPTRHHGPLADSY